MRHLLAAACLFGAVALGQPLDSGYQPVLGNLTLEGNLHFETNSARGRMGLSPLELEPGLTAAARQHAQEMATLDYFSHSSPEPEHETLRHRLAKAGSPLVTVGENLAILQGQPDLAKAAVAGWLDSPGHRRNLLDPSFTHVGFGTAVNGRGETVIVQVLAFKPGQLVGFDLDTEALATTTVTVRVRASATVTGLLSVAGVSGQPTTLETGEHALELVLVDPEGDSFHVRLGAALAGGNGYGLEDAAWLDLVSGTWRRDPGGARQYLEIAGMQLTRSLENATHLRFRYRQQSQDRYAVFLAGEHLPSATPAAGTVDLVIPNSAVGLPIQVGVVEGNSVAIFHAFELQARDGGIALAPASP